MHLHLPVLLANITFIIKKGIITFQFHRSEISTLFNLEFIDNLNFIEYLRLPRVIFLGFLIVSI